MGHASLIRMCKAKGVYQAAGHAKWHLAGNKKGSSHVIRWHQGHLSNYRNRRPVSKRFEKDTKQAKQLACLAGSSGLVLLPAKPDRTTTSGQTRFETGLLFRQLDKYPKIRLSGVFWREKGLPPCSGQNVRVMDVEGWLSLKKYSSHICFRWIESMK